MQLNAFVKEKRRLAGLTQPELAEKAGAGLRFVRELEQGKTALRLDKVNQGLQLFGHFILVNFKLLFRIYKDNCRILSHDYPSHHRTASEKPHLFSPRQASWGHGK